MITKALPFSKIRLPLQSGRFTTGNIDKHLELHSIAPAKSAKSLSDHSFKKTQATSGVKYSPAPNTSQNARDQKPGAKPRTAAGVVLLRARHRKSYSRRPGTLGRDRMPGQSSCSTNHRRGS